MFSSIFLISSLIEIFREIHKAIGKLSLRHRTHIQAYGKDNERRLTGKHETASVC